MPTIPAGAIAKKLVSTCHTVLEDQIDDAFKLFDEAHSAPWPEWSRWVQEQPTAQRSYLRTLWDFGQAIGMLVVSSGFDHAEALRDTFSISEDGPRLRNWSYLTLARGASEGFVRGSVILDRAVDPEASVLRSAASTLDGWLEQEKMARDIETTDPTPDGSTLTSAERMVAQELVRLRRAGLVVVSDSRKRPVALTRGSSRAALSINVTTESARLLDIPVPYRMGSAAAHSSYWFLASAVTEGEGGRMIPRPDPNVLVMATLLTLESLLSVVTATAPGHALTQELYAKNQRRKGTVLSTLKKWHGDLGPQGDFNSMRY